MEAGQGEGKGFKGIKVAPIPDVNCMQTLSKLSEEAPDPFSGWVERSVSPARRWPCSQAEPSGGVWPEEGAGGNPDTSIPLPNLLSTAREGACAGVLGPQQALPIPV